MAIDRPLPNGRDPVRIHHKTEIINEHTDEQ
jgi:hypothetical protein